MATVLIHFYLQHLKLYCLYCFPTNKIQDIQQPDNYETDSDNASDEEAVHGRTCTTGSGTGRSVQDHNWCVWFYEDGVILMVI